MHPILFKIGNFTFFTHGLLAVAGIVAGAIILYWLSNRAKLENTYLFDQIVYAVLIGIVGARVTYFFLYHDQFTSVVDLLKLWQGGMVSYGGFILGGAAFAYFWSHDKQNLAVWLDLLGIAFPLGLFFGRIGNIFAGEYAGYLTQSRFNIQGFIPVNLYEGLLVLLIFAGLLLIYLKNIHLQKGMIFLLSIGAYGLGRFIIDFWRDEKILLLHLSLGQILSLVLFIFVLGFILKNNLKKGSNGSIA